MALNRQEELSPKDKDFAKSIYNEKIVVSGIAGLYPSSHHVKDLSQILYNKIDPITRNTRWTYNHPEVAKHSGNIPDLETFDAQFFKVHFRQAENMDPLGRKILEQSYAAIYDAGVSPEHLSGKKVGVYIGSCFSETEKSFFYVENARNGFGISGSSKTMFANRVSYWLNVKGPSMAIDESCSSSITALEAAFLDIRSGECEAAIVGGSNICIHPQSSIHYGRIIKLSKDGKTKSFDSEATGCVRSEAINVVFLQKAKDAYRIYAEIVHVKSQYDTLLKSEDGPKYGFYRETSRITNFLKGFYEEAKVKPKLVQYVEAFGSAVPIADKVELDAIDEVFCTDRNKSLMVGSVMSNIGYGEAASGISALTKVLLGYYTGKIAPNLHCDSPHKDVVAFQKGRLQVVSEAEEFDRSYSAVNNFSITGNNAHVLLRGLYKPKDPFRYKSNIPHLVLISARTDTGVSSVFDDIKSRDIDPEELALFNKIHGTKISGHHGRGFMILESNNEKGTVCLSKEVRYFDEAKRPVWFVYSGMGSQWSGMGAQLMRIPIFAAAIEKCRRVLEPKEINIVEIITSPDKRMFDNILHSFVGIAAIQIGLTNILLALNIIPDKIIGHSVGELGCAYVDGCFTAEEMILAAYYRGLVSVQTPFIRGSMAAVGLGYAKVLKLCPPEVEVACHNGPDSCTISGPAVIMKDFVKKLTEKGVFAKEVPCSNIAYHSRYIAEAGPGLLKYLSKVITSPKPRSDRWVSTSIPQEKWNEPIAKYSSAEYHTNNLLNPVLFEETSKLIPPNAVVVEVAPHGLLQAILKRSLPETCLNVHLTRRGHADNVLFLLEAIGRLYTEGCLPEISALYPKVEFPVSTETPMLSHVVQWVHQEKWFIPLYESADRKYSSCCNFVLSIYDKEHEYLSGNIIRGKNVYPIAAMLVAAWDTLSMTLGVELKTLPVQFENVHLHSQPILHKSQQLRLSVTVHRGTGRFQVMVDSVIIANGFIKQNNVSPCNASELNTTESKDIHFNSEEIYQMLHSRDSEYKNAFRSLLSANMVLSSAEIIWENNWVTFIDGVLQLGVLRNTHDSVSQPKFIRKITIDVNNHLNKTYEINGKVVIKADSFDYMDRTRCGGVTLENVQYFNVPILNKEIVLQTLKFVPYFPVKTNMNLSSALSVFLQIVAENLNKKTINILELIDSENSLSNYEEIDTVLNTLPGLDGRFLQINEKDIFDQNYNSLANIDVLLVVNWKRKEYIKEKLISFLQNDTFIINKDYLLQESNSLQNSKTYRIISAFSMGQMNVELIQRGLPSTESSSVLTVRSHSDLNFLCSALTKLPANHKLIVLSSNPPVPGLKSLIKQHRTELKCKVNLIMINHEILGDISEQDLQKNHDWDLAFTVIDQGVSGGEYYLPIEKKNYIDMEVALKIGKIAALDTLRWEIKAEPIGPGVTVKVEYAGINTVEVNRQLGFIKTFSNHTKSDAVIDFSGTTLSGTRVMGLTQAEGISSCLKSNPNSLWPVPAHWSFEDAATVSLAYSMAFYILYIKFQLCSNFNIFVHGGAGALGQAIISIALASNCEVFTTVSDKNKKNLLKKLFPKLKDEHIGNSRDSSFGDVILSATKGKKCNIVIICSKTEYKQTCLNCCGARGIIYDLAQIHNREEYSFGMHNLTQDRSYIILNFSSILMPEYAEDMKKIQILLSEGITKGFVRPLTRVTFAPQDVPRAYRFVASSRHRGRVLLDLRQAKLFVQPSLLCPPELCQLVCSDNEIIGIKFVDMLISRGAKKIILQLNNVTKCITFKLRCWKNEGVEITLFTDDSCKYQEEIGQIDKMFIILSNDTTSKIEMYLKNISAIASSILPKYFIIIRPSGIIGEQIQLPFAEPHKVMNIFLPPIKQVDKDVKQNITVSINSVLEALAVALSTNEPVVLLHPVPTSRMSLLKQISTIADLNITNDVQSDKTLSEMMDASKVPEVQAYLRNINDIYISEDNVLSLSMKSINDLEKHLTETKFSEAIGLKKFVSYIDPDELRATIEMIFVPTLSNNYSMRYDEYDVNETHLCIVPGVEGCYFRFLDMCERLKLPAFVLQPGLDSKNKTWQELAQIYATTLVDKTGLKKKFYLLGYESGVMVALELAALLEDQGLTGVVYCVGGAPKEIQESFEEVLKEYKTDETMQLAVIKHMVTLMVNEEIKNLNDAFDNRATWKERVYACVNMISSRISYSKQYAVELIEAAYTRILKVRNYKATPRALRSQIISLRPNYYFHNDSYKLSLRDFSKQPVIYYQLDTTLPFAAQDLRCTAIINDHLGEDILEDFRKKNLCMSYLTNADIFMRSSKN